MCKDQKKWGGEGRWSVKGPGAERGEQQTDCIVQQLADHAEKLGAIVRAGKPLEESGTAGFASRSDGCSQETGGSGCPH